jgi:hypothetical protein
MSRGRTDSDFLAMQSPFFRFGIAGILAQKKTPDNQKEFRLTKAGYLLLPAG